MKYLPILDELFSSDSIIFMLIGLAVSIFISEKVKDSGKRMAGFTVSLLVYACCELLSNFHTNYMTELLLLFAGTAAVGSLTGFLAAAAVSKLKTDSPE